MNAERRNPLDIPAQKTADQVQHDRLSNRSDMHVLFPEDTAAPIYTEIVQELMRKSGVAKGNRRKK